MAQDRKDLSGRRRPTRPVPADAAGGPDPVARRIEVRPEDVRQRDRRPWRRLSLDGVVARMIALSALALLSLLAALAGFGRLFGLW